jgi:hypothetical protein
MPWIGFLVLLGLSIFFAGQAIYESSIRARLRKKEVLIEGLITDINAAGRSGQCHVIYSYEYNGKTYTGQQLVNQETAQSYHDLTEKSVTVSCLPEHPSIARLTTGPVYGRTILFAVASLIGALLFAYVAFTSLG